MNSLQNQSIFENLWKISKSLFKRNPVKEKPIVKIGWKWWWSIKEWVKRIETMDVNYFIINCIIPMLKKYTKTNHFWQTKRFLNSEKGLKRFIMNNLILNQPKVHSLNSTVLLNFYCYYFLPFLSQWIFHWRPFLAFRKSLFRILNQNYQTLDSF